jgi:Peptidase MA superfamily
VTHRLVRFARFVGLLLGLLCITVAPIMTPSALAAGHANDTNDEPVASPPRDVPLVLPAASLTIPSLPPTYQQRDLGWITIAYPPSVHERVRPLIDEAEAFKATLTDMLGQSVLDRPQALDHVGGDPRAPRHVDVRVARSADDMAAMAPREVPPPAYASGVAYPSLRLVLLSLTAPVGGEPTELDEVFRHELFHIALEDAVNEHHVPLWFNEGMAIYVSGEHPWLRKKTLWDATLSRSVIDLSHLDRAFPSQSYEASIAYAESADFVRFLLRDQDHERFLALIERVRGGQPFDRALSDAYDTDSRKIEYQWREDIAKRYTFAPVLASGALVWVVALGILVLGYTRKRRRDRAILARWEEEEALQQGPLQIVPSDLSGSNAGALSQASPVSQGVPADISRRGLPKIEHEGGWHTVH